MIFSWTRLKKTLIHIPPFVQRFALVLIGMHLLNLFFNQSMISLQEMRMEQKSDNFIPYMFAVAFIGFVVQSLTKVIWILLICYHFHHKTPLLPYLKKYTEMGLIESLRAFFRSILWGFLLIVPGLIKMIRYQFVLFVVASSKSYEAGDLDALKGSEDITRGYFWRLTLLVLFFAIGTFSLSSTQPFLTAPVEVFLTEFFGFFFVSLQGLYMLFLFQDLLAKRDPA